MGTNYASPGPSRDEVDSLDGGVLLEFGTDWCGHCQRVAPAVESALLSFPAIRHIKVEDGPGRRLGRSFGVKLWPTLIFLKAGAEVARLVRPRESEEIRDCLRSIA